MIIVSFNDIAPVAPQNVDKSILAAVLYGCNKLLDEATYDEITQSLTDWETDLFMNSLAPDDDWYTRALVCICLRGLRGELRPNILNISE